MALFKKKESSLLDTPPPLMATKQQKPLNLDLPPMPPALPQMQSMQQSMQLDSQSMDSPPMFNSLQSQQRPQSQQSQLDMPPMPSSSPSAQFTFPDIPEEDSFQQEPAKIMATAEQPIKQSVRNQSDSEYEFDINETLFSQASKQKMAPPMVSPFEPIDVPPQIMPQQSFSQSLPQSFPKSPAQSQQQPIQQPLQQKTSNVYKDKDTGIQTVAREQPSLQSQLQQKQLTKPIFISLQQYKRAMNNIETMYNDVTIASDTVFRFFQLYNDMDTAFNDWQHSLDHLQEDMVDLDKALFKFA